MVFLVGNVVKYHTLFVTLLICNPINTTIHIFYRDPHAEPIFDTA